MKKKCFFALSFLALSIAGCALYWHLGQISFDEAFQGYSPESPGVPTDSFTVVQQGTCPGFGDTPVTFEESSRYRELLAALRGQDYLPLPPLSGIPDGGIAAYVLSGCTPECIAYWDGNFLWLPAAEADRWNRFLPLPPHSLGKYFNTLCNY